MARSRNGLERDAVAVAPTPSAWPSESLRVSWMYTEAVSRRRRSAQGAENPYEKGTSMGLLRAESIRTCRELGYVTDGDRVVSVDRALGKAHDAFAVAQTLKIYTVSAEGGEI